MDKINIYFTKSQIETLIELLYLGEWMHEAHQKEDSKEVTDLVQLIFSTAYETGFKNIIKYNSELGAYCLTIGRREINHLLVGQYDENVFRQKLVQNRDKRSLTNVAVMKQLTKHQ